MYESTFRLNDVYFSFILIDLRVRVLVCVCVVCACVFITNKCYLMTQPYCTLLAFAVSSVLFHWPKFAQAVNPYQHVMWQKHLTVWPHAYKQTTWSISFWYNKFYTWFPQIKIIEYHYGNSWDILVLVKILMLNYFNVGWIIIDFFQTSIQLRQMNYCVWEMVKYQSML